MAGVAARTAALDADPLTDFSGGLDPLKAFGGHGGNDRTRETTTPLTCKPAPQLLLRPYLPAWRQCSCRCAFACPSAGTGSPRQSR